MSIKSVYAIDQATTLEAYSVMTKSAPPSPVASDATAPLEALVEAIGARAIDWSWMAKAACHDADTDDFFVAPMSANSTVRTAESSERKQRAVADRYCTNCRVAEQCLEYALATGSKDGVWGGKTERERKVILRRRRLEAAS